MTSHKKKPNLAKKNNRTSLNLSCVQKISQFKKTENGFKALILKLITFIVIKQKYTINLTENYCE